jgi:MoaA/NifB/PqqE/SkfB family radical SAM enzyme
MSVREDQRVETLCVELTARCPLRCSHCSANAAPERTELIDVDVLAAQLQQLPSLTEVYLSGGEPFEHPRLVKAVIAARQASKNVAIYSSGVVIDDDHRNAPLPIDRLRAVRDAGITRIDLSIYSDVADEHDEVTATLGSFALTLESASRLRKLGMSFGVHYVPIVEGGARASRLAALADSMGACRFHVLALVAQGRAGTNRLSTNLEDAGRAQLRRLWEAHASYRAEIVLSSELRRQIGVGEPTQRDRRRALFVDVRGHLYPCEGRRLPILRTQSSILGDRSIRDIVDELSTH